MKQSNTLIISLHNLQIGILHKFSYFITDSSMYKGIVKDLVWKITTRIYFWNISIKQKRSVIPDRPQLACQGGAERRLVEGSVPLRSVSIPLRRDWEPQCDNAFNYYDYFFLLLFIRMIFNKFSLKCYEYEKFWGMPIYFPPHSWQHNINLKPVAKLFKVWNGKYIIIDRMLK